MPAAPEPDAEILRERQHIGERIRHLRNECELTQEQVAERSGLDRKTISRGENGRFPLSPDHLLMIARAIGVQLVDRVAE